MPVAPIYFGKLKPRDLTNEKCKRSYEVDLMRFNNKANKRIPSDGKTKNVDKVFFSEHFVLKIS